MRYLLAPLFFLGLPLAYSAGSLDPALLSRALMLSLLLCLAFGYLAMAKTNFKVDVSPISLAWLGLWVLSALSIPGAHNKVDAVFHFGTLTLATMTFFLFAHALRTGLLRIESLSLSITLASLAQMLLAILQKYAGLSIFGGDLGHLGTLTHPNIFSAYTLACLPFVVYGVIKGKGWGRSLATIALSLSFIMIVVVKTRSAWVGLATMAAVGALIIRRDRELRVELLAFWGRSRKIILAQSALTGVLLALLVGLDFRDVSEHVFTLAKAESSGRIPIWKETLGLIREHPVTGVGVGNWRLHVKATEVFWQSPHNEFLRVASEAGLPGLACFLAIGVAAVGAGIARMRAGALEARIPAAVLVLSISALAVDAFFAFPLGRIESLVLSAFVCAALGVHGSRRPKEWPRIFLVVPMLATIVIALVSFQRMAGEATLKQVIEDANPDPAEQIRRLSEIDRRFYNVDNFSTPIEYHFALARLKQGDAAAARRHLENAAQLAPLHPRVMTNLATTYDRLGRGDEAMAWYRKALDMYPEDHGAAVNLAIILFNRGEAAEAGEVLRGVRPEELSPDSERNYRLLKVMIRLGE